MKKKVRIALLGSGTVGGGVLRLLSENRDALAKKIGAELEVTRVLVRDLAKGRVPECRPEWMTVNPDDIFADPELDIIIEVMGGEEPAKSLIERAMERGISVVSANKFLLAKHGPELLAAAQAKGIDLAFEASVGGGIPIIRTLREAMTGDSVESVVGILNGTCNYILTRMRDAKKSFAEALAEAQELGYAEADPTLDIEGHDAAQKLVVASMLAFGSRLSADAPHIEGITKLDAIDFEAAERFGYAIKHLVIGRDLGDRVSLRAHPTFVKKSSVIARIDGVLNCVLLRGRALGPCVLVGRGAGDLPTAVSIVADLVDVARSRIEGDNGLSTRAIMANERPLLSIEELESRYYLRVDVTDTPGVLGIVATTLGRHQVSIEQMVQEGHESDRPVSILMVTHLTREGSLQKAMSELGKEGFLRASPRFIRIEDV
jgi:homoserine dehydrogenase